MEHVPITRWEVVLEIYRSRIGSAIKGLFLLLGTGTIGYWTLGQLHEHHVLNPPLPAGEHWSLSECLYFTAISLSTVGYGETITSNGSLAGFTDVRMFTVGVLLLGMIATAYFLSSATAFFVEGDLKRVLEKRRMLKQIAALTGHYIICGAGQTGRHIAEEVTRSGKECVIIDTETRPIAELADHGVKVHSIIGEATKDETLIEAGIERAIGLAASLPDDKDNLFLVISARQLNPKLRIVAKAVDMPTRGKLLKAGADGVVASNYIGGMRMASELVRPNVVNFLDQMLRSKEAPVRFAEVVVGACEYATLAALDSVKRAGLPILAIKSPRQEGFTYNPSPESRLGPGTVLVVMGEVDSLKKLEDLVKADKSGAYLGPQTNRLAALPTMMRPVIDEKELQAAEPAKSPAPAPAPTPVRTRLDDLKDPRDNL